MTVNSKNNKLEATTTLRKIANIFHLSCDKNISQTKTLNTK